MAFAYFQWELSGADDRCRGHHHDAIVMSGIHCRIVQDESHATFSQIAITFSKWSMKRSRIVFESFFAGSAQLLVAIDFRRLPLPFRSDCLHHVKWRPERLQKSVVTVVHLRKCHINECSDM
jgi:hypothetical protein